MPETEKKKRPAICPLARIRGGNSGTCLNEGKFDGECAIYMDGECAIVTFVRTFQTIADTYKLSVLNATSNKKTEEW